MKLMERKQIRVTRQFFKVMMPGFHQKLNLPPNVSKELQKQKSRRATLQSQIGTWKISMCKNYENDLICFNQGWPQFVDHHALTIGDFLVFEHTGELHFNVIVFDSSACEKEFRVEPNKEKEEATHLTSHLTKTGKDEAENENPYFVKTMVPRYASMLAKVNIPIEFMRSNNLGQQTSVVLRDPSGREWAVKFSAGMISMHPTASTMEMFAIFD